MFIVLMAVTCALSAAAAIAMNIRDSRMEQECVSSPADYQEDLYKAAS